MIAAPNAGDATGSAPRGTGIAPCDQAHRAPREEVLSDHLLLTGTANLDTFIEAVDGMVLILNGARQVVHANHAAREFFGVTDDSLHSLVGQRLGEALGCRWSSAPPGGCGTTPACRLCGSALAMSRAWAQDKPSTHVCSILTRDLQAIEFRVRAAPVMVAGRRFLVLTLTDASDHHWRNTLEHTFLHDQGNAIATLDALTRRLHRTQPAELPAVRDNLLRVARHLAEALSRHRDLLAAERGDLPVRCQSIDAASLTAEVAAACSGLDAAAGRHLRVMSAPEDVALRTDPVLLRRVLQNLVINAIEASRPGDTVTLSSGRIGSPFVFQVSNPAVIPAAEQGRIFVRSFTTRGTGRGTGTYAAKLLTERFLQGTISFQSAPGRGTVFTVSVPAALAGA